MVPPAATDAPLDDVYSVEHTLSEYNEVDDVDDPPPHATMRNVLATSESAVAYGTHAPTLRYHVVPKEVLHALSAYSMYVNLPTVVGLLVGTSVVVDTLYFT